MTTTTMKSEKNIEHVTTEVPVMDIRNLNVHSKTAHILKNINLTVPKNKITVLLGPSGCGKTTLLKCMNRLTDLYSELRLDGSIEIDGQNILTERNNITEIRQKMGLVMK